MTTVRHHSAHVHACPSRAWSPRHACAYSPAEVAPAAAEASQSGTASLDLSRQSRSMPGNVGEEAGVAAVAAPAAAGAVAVAA